MTTQALLASCRAELERQKKMPEYMRAWHGKARLAVAEDLLDVVKPCGVLDDETVWRGMSSLYNAAKLLGVDVSQ
jgi:hypothetical protein